MPVGSPEGEGGRAHRFRAGRAGIAESGRASLIASQVCAAMYVVEGMYEGGRRAL